MEPEPPCPTACEKQSWLTNDVLLGATARGPDGFAPASSAGTDAISGISAPCVGQKGSSRHLSEGFPRVALRLIIAPRASDRAQHEEEQRERGTATRRGIPVSRAVAASPRGQGRETIRGRWARNRQSNSGRRENIR
jgi:hypothetical protein